MTTQAGNCSYQYVVVVTVLDKVKGHLTFGWVQVVVYIAGKFHIVIACTQYAHMSLTYLILMKLSSGAQLCSHIQ